MKRTTLIFLTLALLIVTATAKTGKVKYGKNIIYEGEIEDNIPNGLGNLVITDINDKNIAFISVRGTFKDNVITNAYFNATDFNALEFEGDMKFETKGEKGKAMEVIFHLGKGTLFHDDIEYLYRKIRSIGIDGLEINVSTTKQTKEWAIRFGPNASQTTSFKASIPDMPLPRNIDLLGYSPEKITGFYADFHINEVLVNSTGEGQFVFIDGTTFCKDEVKFADGDIVRFANNDWTGAMTYADGTHISKDNADLFKIDFKNGDSYIGTLKRSSLQDLARRSTDRPNFKYNNGVLTTNGVEEKWINGESFSQRHDRLSEVMRQELVLAVEDGSMTEQQAVKREKELKIEDARLAARRLEFADDSLSLVNNRYPYITGTIKGKIYKGKVTLKDEEDAVYAKRVQLWLTVSFVTASRCVLTYKGNVVAKDDDTAEYFNSLVPTFIEEGSYAYRIEDDIIYLYDTLNYERQKFSFKLSNKILHCNELGGTLNKC